MVCWLYRAPMTEDQATDAATSLPRSVRAKEAQSHSLRYHGEWRDAQS